ncbi:MAG: cation:proton antiporter [Bacillaceae bacterium]|nr:cation:proton antiporter [Bacillaceae bacterium]
MFADMVAHAESFYFLFELALIVLAIKVLGHLSIKIGQPSVFGKLLVGVILGPSLLNILHPNPLITELAEVGVILLMFLAGLETDVDEFKKVAFGSTTVAIGGVVLPFIGGIAVAMLYGYESSVSIFVGVLLVATSVSISVQTLRELGKLKSREGTTILGAAVLDDVLGIIILSVVLGFVAGGAEAGAGGLAGIGFLLIKIIVFFALAVAIGYFILPKLLKWFNFLQTTETLLAFGVIVALLYGYGAELFGVAGIVGSYVAGLMLSLTSFREELSHKVESFSFPFFVPIFFVNIGLVANFKDMSMEVVILSLILTVVAILTKIIGCGLGAKVAKFNNNSSMVIGSGMVARGEVGLIVAMIGVDRGIINTDLFSTMVIVAIATTLATPPLLKYFIKKQSETEYGT